MFEANRVEDSPIEFVRITSEEGIEEVRELFREYAASLDTDLCFQQFEEELTSLPGKYAPPDGTLMLAKVNGDLAGCIALRPAAEGICEMKRLYVRNSYRGMGLGKQLVARLIREAEYRRYRFMRLDTLPVMKEAQRLYEAFGFYDIEPYVFNPVEGVRFMELKIS